MSLTLLIGFSLLAGTLSCTTQPAPEPGATSQSGVSDTTTTIDWRDARKARTHEGYVSAWKYHKVIDWGASRGVDRVRQVRNALTHDVIHWQEDENQTSNPGHWSSGNQRSTPEQKTESKLVHVSDDRQESNLRVTTPSKNRSEKQVNDQKQELDRPSTVVETDSREPSRTNQKSTSRMTSEKHTPVVSGDEEKTDRSGSKPKSDAIYLNEIDWRDIPD